MIHSEDQALHLPLLLSPPHLYLHPPLSLIIQRLILPEVRHQSEGRLRLMAKMGKFESSRTMDKYERLESLVFLTWNFYLKAAVNNKDSSQIINMFYLCGSVVLENLF